MLSCPPLTYFYHLIHHIITNQQLPDNCKCSPALLGAAASSSGAKSSKSPSTKSSKSPSTKSSKSPSTKSSKSPSTKSSKSPSTKSSKAPSSNLAPSPIVGGSPGSPPNTCGVRPPSPITGGGGLRPPSPITGGGSKSGKSNPPPVRPAVPVNPPVPSEPLVPPPASKPEPVPPAEPVVPPPAPQPEPVPPAEPVVPPPASKPEPVPPAEPVVPPPATKPEPVPPAEPLVPPPVAPPVPEPVVPPPAPKPQPEPVVPAEPVVPPPAPKPEPVVPVPVVPTPPAPETETNCDNDEDWVSTTGQDCDAIAGSTTPVFLCDSAVSAEGVSAADACLGACKPECLVNCEDDSGWLSTSDVSCKDVSEDRDNLCSEDVVSADGVSVIEACPSSCIEECNYILNCGYEKDWVSTTGENCFDISNSKDPVGLCQSLVSVEGTIALDACPAVCSPECNPLPETNCDDDVTWSSTSERNCDDVSQDPDTLCSEDVTLPSVDGVSVIEACPSSCDPECIVPVPVPAPISTLLPTEMLTSTGTAESSGGSTITVSTETTGPPTVALRDGERR